MLFNIIKDTENTPFVGCDFVIRLPRERKGTNIKILQLTDMQIIDSAQMRTPDRLRPDEIEAWLPRNFDAQCGNHIRSLVAQSRPDLIFITGDIVYGSFDDAGTSLKWMCELMDSFGIPWAPTFGNHDNESKLGVSWQCEQFEKSQYCLFKRGSVTGNSNYTVGIAIGDELIRVLHALDSNGCKNGNDPSIIKNKGLYPDQLELVTKNTALISEAQGKSIPAFLAFHIPTDAFLEAERAKGYTEDGENLYVIGVDAQAKDGDFGFRLEKYRPIETDGHFPEFLSANNIDGVFVGHVHNDCTCISYKDIKWVFGLKTGQYDYHIPGQTGGTLITLREGTFDVNHIPSLVHYAPMPNRAPMFRDFFAAADN